MPHNKIKNIFLSAVNSVTADPELFAVNPAKDFSRRRKITPDALISFLVSKGSSSARVEMLDFWGMDQTMPSLSALNQQRAKLRPEALEAVLAKFNDSVSRQANFPFSDKKYRYLAADGSTTTFFSTQELASPEYFCSSGHSANGFYSIHINAFFDLDSHIYTDAILQPLHEKNEFGAFCDIVDRHGTLPGRKNVYIADRGYCSYNNMAHVVEQGQYFLFRTKDIHSKGLVGNFEFPETESFDVDVAVTLTRSHSRKVSVPPGSYRRFIDQASTFDLIEYGSLDTYTLAFRVVRFPIGDDSYECIVTNLPRDDFSPEKLKALYCRRWSIESSFRKLKYTIGLSNYHSYKPEYIKQEIWADLIAYNITEMLVNSAVIEKKETKYEYKVNFTMAAHICRVFLRLSTEKDRYNVMLLLQKELIPIRNERQYPRLQTAHFRKPRYFIYRAA